MAALCSLAVKWDQNDVVPYNLFVKKHSLRKEDKKTPNGLTVFVINVPAYWTETSLHHTFSTFGPVDAIYVQHNPGPVAAKDESSVEIYNCDKDQYLKFAYVVFKDQDSVERVIKAGLAGKAICVANAERPPTGMKKWCQEYSLRYPKVKPLQEKVDAYVTSFHTKEAKSNEEEENPAEPDEEGWVTVTKGPKKEKAKPKKLTRREKKKKKAKELINFYQFQQREAKRDHIAELRRKFEEDKKRIALMREQRKFKPF